MSEELMGKLYDDLYGSSESILGKNDFTHSIDLPPDNTSESKKKKEIHGRIDDGALVIDMKNPLLPYGVTFHDSASLQKRCEEYFLSCNGPLRDKNGNIAKGVDGLPIVAQIKPYTLSGLGLHCGIETRVLKQFAQGKYDTPKNKYSHIIKMAAQQIENYAESRLYDKNGYQGGRYILDSAFGRTIKREGNELKDSEFRKQQMIAEFNLKLQALGLNKTDKELDIVISPKRLESSMEVLDLDAEVQDE